MNSDVSARQPTLSFGAKSGWLTSPDAACAAPVRIPAQARNPNAFTQAAGDRILACLGMEAASPGVDCERSLQRWTGGGIRRPGHRALVIPRDGRGTPVGHF